MTGLSVRHVFLSSILLIEMHWDHHPWLDSIHDLMAHLCCHGRLEPERLGACLDGPAQYGVSQDRLLRPGGLPSCTLPASPRRTAPSPCSRWLPRGGSRTILLVLGISSRFSPIREAFSATRNPLSISAASQERCGSGLSARLPMTMAPRPGCLISRRSPNGTAFCP